MSRRDSFVARGRELGLILAAYTLLGALLLPFYRYEINPDGICYISLAQKYMSGNFGNAVTGHWGPLLSWLLVPFLSLGLEPLLAAKLLNLLIGLATIVGVALLSRRFAISGSVRSALLVAVIPVVLFWALRYITPDLLLACILVLYLYVVFDVSYPVRRRAGLAAGALGGLAYLSKHYAFPFFIAHFTLMTILHSLRDKTSWQAKTVMRQYLSGVLVFLIISGPWICTMSLKYRHLTVGTSGQYVAAIHANPESQGHPMFYIGLLEPPNDTAISAWEDPYYITPMNASAESEGVLRSWTSIGHLGRRVFKNVWVTSLSYEKCSVFAVPIIIAYLVVSLKSHSWKALDVMTSGPLLTVALYSAGYLPLLVETRYLVLVQLLLLLMGGHVVRAYYKTHTVTPFGQRAITICLALSFMLPCAARLVFDRNVGRGIYEVSQDLAARGIQGRLASNANWHGSLRVAYHIGGRYLGTTRAGVPEGELEGELCLHDVDYYLLWGDRHEVPKFFRDNEEMTGGTIPGLAVYSTGQVMAK